MKEKFLFGLVLILLLMGIGFVSSANESEVDFETLGDGSVMVRIDGEEFVQIPGEYNVEILSNPQDYPGHEFHEPSSPVSSLLKVTSKNQSVKEILFKGVKIKGPSQIYLGRGENNSIISFDANHFIVETYNKTSITLEGNVYRAVSSAYIEINSEEKLKELSMEIEEEGSVGTSYMFDNPILGGEVMLIKGEGEISLNVDFDIGENRSLFSVTPKINSWLNSTPCEFIFETNYSKENIIIQERDSPILTGTGFTAILKNGELSYADISSSGSFSEYRENLSMHAKPKKQSVYSDEISSSPDPRLKVFHSPDDGVVEDSLKRFDPEFPDSFLIIDETKTGPVYTGFGNIVLINDFIPNEFEARINPWRGVENTSFIHYNPYLKELSIKKGVDGLVMRRFQALSLLPEGIFFQIFADSFPRSDIHDENDLKVKYGNRIINFKTPKRQVSSFYNSTTDSSEESISGIRDLGPISEPSADQKTVDIIPIEEYNLDVLEYLEELINPIGN